MERLEKYWAILFLDVCSRQSLVRSCICGSSDVYVLLNSECSLSSVKSAEGRREPKAEGTNCYSEFCLSSAHLPERSSAVDLEVSRLC